MGRFCIMDPVPGGRYRAGGSGQYAYEKGGVFTLGPTGVFQSRFSCQFLGGGVFSRMLPRLNLILVYTTTAVSEQSIFPISRLARQE
jgi:hypothetical protein